VNTEVIRIRPVVLDASILAELMMRTSAGLACQQRLREEPTITHIPVLAIEETLSVLKGWERAKRLSASAALRAVKQLKRLPATRWEPDQFIDQIWNLRHNFSIYDASYVALATLLDAWVFTSDSRKAIAIKEHTTCKLMQF
jgi:predicted nucleic acid-binding protein